MPEPGDVIVSARGVKRLYRMGEEQVWALGGVDLDIYRALLTRAGREVIAA